MDVREKLVELLAAHCDMKDKRCIGCEKGLPDAIECKEGRFGKTADYLIANGVTVQEWISVKDRLPEDSTYVLARLSGGAIYQALCLTKCNKQWYGVNLERFVNKDTVTHWMPLPQPQKGD